jgi:hypothetical protein
MLIRLDLILVITYYPVMLVAYKRINAPEKLPGAYFHASDSQ